ncbi:MAG: helix-turn-helix domain-containing protein [Ruminiclostridium sp.]|nr:helix-turn-helix domain-containing protein [Ruminiclostridium sp.]
MTLQIGEKIKSLRKKGNCTQEELANALGITCQAVSRWELNTAYPDMELIPAIANYFGITIDELFGCECDRTKKVDEIIEKIDKFHIKSRSDDNWIEECLLILREGIAEFPQNEKLLITLADTLSEAGWRKYGEQVYYDDDGYMRHNFDKHKTNNYWLEAVKICEKLVKTTNDNSISMRATRILVMLYCNLGEYEKSCFFCCSYALSCAFQ